MLQRLRYFGLYGLFWLCFFILGRAYFMAFTAKNLAGSGISDVLNVFCHGIVMDLSATAYLMVIPGILLIISMVDRSGWIVPFIKIYSLIFIVIIGLLVVSDAELYKYWGFRLDATPLLYLKTPKDAFASITSAMIVRELLLAFCLIAGSIFFFKKLFSRITKFEKVPIGFLPIMFFVVIALIIPIRGGFGIAPMNTGKVYFSKNNYLNHAAINLFWNVGFSFSELNPNENQYHFFDDSTQKGLIKCMINQNTPANRFLLKTNKPNVIILVLESFSAKVIGSLGGKPNVTPNINRLSSEGILFTNFFASGDRSDKGLVAVLSGYPAQPSTSIIKFASKTQSLPRLSASLKNDGYNSSFYYGGDIDFANMRSYLLGCGFDHIVSKDDFPASTYNSKWGSHDHVVLDKFYKDICAQKQPFFNVLFTLSSHEPFEVPGHAIPGDDSPSKLMNAIHYTDSCLGNFVAKAKLQPWWQHTLIIMVADHGHPDPGRSPNHVPEKFRIPMLWIGGSLQQPEKVDKYSSQIDIASTLLHQLGLSSENYSFSKNIFSNDPEFAFYAFNNGFGYFTPSEGIVYDCDFNKELINTNNPPSKDGLNIGKAYLQNIYKDLNERK
jgi:phosphoglycerol transferase MdoB-like AlkP superfamily enzyme